ncbi:hypothetical protein [Acidisoma silvae]|uniref:Uncharacterized protein n=1 Tax=Acidisoma silvae TaxID=2802396 RepID=A0A963YQ51_9PROT|nr:hypothetical protein [Acidisoma silvae]MCB8874761.1 hypothetical protein [Acidisoma silvae]
MASGSIAAFSPEATVSVAAGIASNAVALGGSGPSLLVFNSTSSIAFLRLGASTSLTATSGDLPVPAGVQLLLTVGATVTAAAVLLSSGSGTVYLTRGSGSAY